ncbi:hypothetical protein HYU09_01105 [Candidatus Woesearchaeota archaeon]|nr:hypothetical protein [Candidatus Woesearchaeota archaeon]
MSNLDTYGIDESVIAHLTEVYQDRGLESIMGDEDKIESMLRGIAFSKGLIHAPARIQHIIQLLSYVGFGPGKTMVDWGVGYGPVLAVGKIMGGEVSGPEAHCQTAMVALQKFQELRRRGVPTPPDSSIKIGADIMEYDISNADVVWLYAMAKQQPKFVQRFYNFGKSDGKLIVYRPSLECYQTVLKFTQRATFEGSIHDVAMILNKN